MGSRSGVGGSGLLADFASAVPTPLNAGPPPGVFWRFSPPGPKAAGWLMSNHRNTFLMGPVGGGKTTTGAMKCWNVARLQHPSTIDGWRKARIIAIRKNYRQMHRSLIPSLQKFWPEGSPGVTWQLERDGPTRLEFRMEDPQLGKILMIIECLSYTDQDLESFIRGFETTAWWLNEVDELPRGSIGLFNQRAGRWLIDEKPDNIAPVKYSRVFGDLNAPDEDNWFNTDYIMPRPASFELFIQPSGFSSNAENLHILHRDNPNYYADLAEEMRTDKGEWAVRRFIENKPGFSRHGEPVYEDYNDRVHCPDTPPKAHPRIPIIIGLDQGMTPAAAFTQLTPEERFLILAEEVMADGEVEDAMEFGRRCARKLVREFPDHARNGWYKVAPDPAANVRGHTDLVKWIHGFQLGFKEILTTCPVAWPSFAGQGRQQIDVRVGAVREFLRGFSGGEPQLQVSKNCPVIRRGFAGAYRLIRIQKDGGKVRDVPDKSNGADDPADAVQFAAMVARGAVRRGQTRRAPNAPISSASGGSAPRNTRQPTRILDQPL